MVGRTYSLALGYTTVDSIECRDFSSDHEYINTVIMLHDLRNE